MELCLMIEGQEGVTWPQWRALAAACEEHGITSLFRSDHLQNLDGEHPERGSLDAWGTVIALSALTTSLRFGTLVTPTSFRHPSVLGKLIVTADHVSGGRIDIGIGAGWHEREHEAYGFPFLPARARFDVLEEQLQVLMGHWGEEPFSFDGEYYVLSDLEAQPKPIQRPHPPLIIGGDGGPRSAALAARFADEYNTAFATVEQLRQRREAVARACEAAGRDPMPVSAMIGTVIGSDQADLEDRARRVAERIGQAPDALLQNPPEGWIVATVDEAAEQFAAYRDAGLHRAMCQVLVHDDLDAVALLGDELAPRLA